MKLISKIAEWEKKNDNNKRHGAAKTILLPWAVFTG
jgi:hypothetical protein